MQKRCMKCPALFWSLPLAVLSLTACTQFPDLDHTQTAELDAADYPALVPMEPLLASAATPGPDPAQAEDTLNTRLAGLRNRANTMRGSVLTGAEKQRLEAGLR